MFFFGHDFGFWVAAIGAGAVRVVTADHGGPMWARVLRAMAMFFMAIFAAVVFTRPVCIYLGLPLDVYEVPMAAVMALTGEGFMRMFIRATSDLKAVAEAYRIWRGK